MTTITISRSYGSGGDEIAMQVAKQLEYRYFDKRLLAQVASEVALSEVQMVDFSEDTYQTRSFLDRLFGRSSPVLAEAQIRVWREDPTGVRRQEVERLDEEYVLSLIQGVILAVHRKGDIVIMGRGGQAILKEMPDVLHVRVDAPLVDRVRRVQEQEEISQNEAQERVIQRDKAAADYLKRYYGIDWSDPMLYHLVINTGKLDIPIAVHLISEAVKKLQQVEVSL